MGNIKFSFVKNIFFFDRPLMGHAYNHRVNCFCCSFVYNVEPIN